MEIFYNLDCGGGGGYTTIHFPNSQNSTFQEGEHYYIKLYLNELLYRRYLPIGSMATWFEGRLGFPVPLTHGGRGHRCSYSKPSIRPVGTVSCHCHWHFIYTDPPTCSHFFAFHDVSSHLGATVIFWWVPSSVMPSRETSNICNVSGGPGMSAARQR